jgi:hypothetical protein
MGYLKVERTIWKYFWEKRTTLMQLIRGKRIAKEKSSVLANKIIGFLKLWCEGLQQQIS